MSSRPIYKDFLPHIRGVILLLGILAGLWVTFIHPPLVLMGSSGSTVNARARCAVVGENYRESAPDISNSSGEYVPSFGEPQPKKISVEDETEAKNRTQDCLKLATVNVPNVFLQLCVIAATTWLLMSFTRIIK